MADWVPVFRCCWCGSEFVQRTIDRVVAWTCPTDECFERQLAYKQLTTDNRLFFLPLPKQVELIDAIETQAFGALCIGGHRNSAKSHTLRMIAYRYCKRFENLSVLFLRRSMPELRLNHMRFALRETKQIGAKYNTNSVMFDNDSEVAWGSCFEDDDFKAYIGGDFDLIIFDQLEEFTRQQYVEIAPSTGRTRKRPDWRGLILAGENPGGPLSAFVEELFIDKNPNLTTYPDYDASQYAFIDARLEDNPYADPRYVNNLAGLSPERRAMFRFGRRDVFPRQFFKSFVRHDRVRQIDVPPDVPRLCGLHWGYFRPGIFLWAVVLPDGRLYLEREFEFSEMVASDVAKHITEINTAHRTTISAAWGNPVSEISADDIGEHTFETLFLHGLPVIRSMHDPINGWQRLQHWFQPMLLPTGEQPALIVSPECSVLIRTLPQLLQADVNPEDLDDHGAVHVAKALRYLVMSRPEPPGVAPKPEGRDLSRLDERVRAEIEYLREAEQAADARAEAGPYSLGDFWGARE
jgi:phage terminase large subunit